ncbi:hypothetical protein CHS0354_004237, partial [Potamilus streckersoni]
MKEEITDHMNGMKMLLFLVTVAFVDLYIVCGQECNSIYDVLPDVERRSRNYKVAQDEPFVTDAHLVYKWYDLGNMNMPNNDTNIFEERERERERERENLTVISEYFMPLDFDLKSQGVNVTNRRLKSNQEPRLVDTPLRLYADVTATRVKRSINACVINKPIGNKIIGQPTASLAVYA